MTTSIEWTATLNPDGTTSPGETWNPIRARHKETGAVGWHCEVVSPGCGRCYAQRQNETGARGGTKLPYAPSSLEQVEVYLDEKTLSAPLHWKKPSSVLASR